MPRYYFAFFDGCSVIDDTEGTELPDLGTAQHEAAKDVKHLRQPRISGRQSWAGWTVRVLNEGGTILVELPFNRRASRRRRA